MFRKRTVSRQSSSMSSFSESETDGSRASSSRMAGKESRKMSSASSFLRHRLSKKKHAAPLTEEERVMVTDTITLQEILDDIELHIEFELFLGTQHALENLWLWQELIAFANRDPDADAPAAAAAPAQSPEADSPVSARRRSSKRRASRRPSRKTEPAAAAESDPALDDSSPPAVRSSSLASRRKSSRRPSKKSAHPSSSRRSLKSHRHAPSPLWAEAQRLFDQYMRPNAPQWVSLDDRTYRTVAKALEERPHEVTNEFFVDIQRSVFNNMQSDLVPRFIKSMLGRHAHEQPTLLEQL